MDTNSTLILNHRQLAYKIKRLAWQIYENNMDEPVLWIAGIDARGMYIANRIAHELSGIGGQDLKILSIKINRQTFEADYTSEHDLGGLRDATVILVDDVLNSGKTIISAMLPLVAKQVKKIQVVVLASRSHRKFPVKADYVGISMATTLQEHLSFDNSDEQNLKLFLN